MAWEVFHRSVKSLDSVSTLPTQNEHSVVGTLTTTCKSMILTGGVCSAVNQWDWILAALSTN
ncbi:uncharacterized protein CYBJADRAFT_168406 [Cyberlindnera jadinii NRRL Y-1542]|uniref:Uncharacterized protein n=1 Tax=Cyberlindnera jadinii (strain ATCC 18201 / CBS 1600 / BCRC 20928 / JCM 3617 / NBRC 0987 / NRRL Y-1542) TaxID=983966 RepID=A0A1E4S090_CYBJN|nr:hypothetical protein CYBJADRAFT_168406 [Cyberlindnera jadinii NRRL Y-1542]ODV72909.1 hypothetical protein CYBJADRAFT_168406 [Cyberlindnera jadinii NRRL Y-1542]